jgi:hypothetical protein
MDAIRKPAPEFATANNDQGENSLARERQLAVWQAEIAREAQKGRGIEALHKVLSELRKKFESDEAFLFPAIDNLHQCADRHLSESRGPEIIDAIFEAIFPGFNSDFDDATIKLDTLNEIKRLASLSLLEYERERVAAAERLGIRASILDAIVKAARAEHAKGQGRAPSIAEAEPWPEQVDLAAALQKATQVFARYLILPSGGAEIMAIWSFLTYCFQLFSIVPRLLVTAAERECAKSLLLRVLKCASARCAHDQCKHRSTF